MILITHKIDVRLTLLSGLLTCSSSRKYFA
jgi:hypothetical protein